MSKNLRNESLAANICSRCGKLVGKQNLGSLTNWLFQETVCQCAFVDSLGKDEHSKADSAQQIYGDVFNLPDLGKAFQVKERIGKGGMGSVYRAVEVASDRPVAIKLLHEHLKDDPQSVSRFKQEAQAVISLSHENLVKAIAWGSSAAGAPYLAMEYVEGEPLDRVLVKETFLEVREAVQIFMQICEALSHAHQHGIIHRDVKPGNIILTMTENSNRSAKLVDFGIAKVRSINARETHNLTQTGDVFGSPQYMSPEQCLGFELDSRSDIYSLGCVMYECLSGKPPYVGRNPVQLIAKHLSAELPALRICDASMGVRFNARLEEIVARCIAKEPAARYMSAELLAGELRALLSETPSIDQSMPALGRKLDLVRVAFTTLTAASVALSVFTFLPPEYSLSMPIHLLPIMPAISSVLACLMIAERMQDVVSRLQFLPLSMRQDAAGCMRALVLCLFTSAICFSVTVYPSAFAMNSIHVPVFSAGLSVLVAAVVWASFFQGFEKSAIDANILAGKVISGVALCLIAVLTVYLLLSEKAPNVITVQRHFDDLDNANVSDEAVRILAGDRKYSTFEKKNGQSLHVFRFPKGMCLGYFKTKSGNIPAKDKVEFAWDEPIHFVPDMTQTAGASLMLGFRNNDIACLSFVENTTHGLTAGSVNDFMYFISTWTGLVVLEANSTDLSDFGLSKINNCNHLRALSVCDTDVTAEGLSKLPQLKNLRMLHACGLKNAGVVLKAMSHSPALTMLDLSDCQLADADFEELGKRSNLESLYLNGSVNLNDHTLRYLTGLSKLKYLSIAGSKVTSNSIFLFSGFKKLKSLIVDFDGWNEVEFGKLKKALPKDCNAYRVTVSRFGPGSRTSINEL